MVGLVSGNSFSNGTNGGSTGDSTFTGNAFSEGTSRAKKAPAVRKHVGV